MPYDKNSSPFPYTARKHISSSCQGLYFIIQSGTVFCGLLLYPIATSAAAASLTWIVLLLLLSHFSHVRLFVTPWTTAYQAPSSMGFSRQEYWSGVPLPSPLDCAVISKLACLPQLSNLFFNPLHYYRN